MTKDLYMKDKPSKTLVHSEDLSFDGKNIIIPSYYSSLIIDYIKDWNLQNQRQIDIEDYVFFKNFLYKVEEYKNQGI